MDRQTCSNCKFYFLDAEIQSDDTGETLDSGDFMSECRRYPPARNENKASGVYADFEMFSGPFVQAINWCGEWRAK